TEPRLLSRTLSSPASFVRTQSTNAFAAGRFLLPFRMLMAPTSKPVSFGMVRSILAGALAFSVRMSWAQFGAPAASALAIDVITPGQRGRYATSFGGR